MAAVSDEPNEAVPPPAKHKRAAPLNQVDVPSCTLREAARVAEMLRDQFAKQPTAPLDLAIALDLALGGSQFKKVTGASIAYGLTDGGAQASSIALTDLGRRVVAPTAEGDDLAALREAALRPRVIREFLEKYNGSPLPTSRTIAKNVIEQMGVPSDATDRAYDMILKNAEQLGLLAVLKDKQYVRLDSFGPTLVREPEGDAPKPLADTENVVAFPSSSDHAFSGADESSQAITAVGANGNRVFITHGQNVKVVEQIKKILTFGKFEAVQSVAQQTVAKPVPDKVMDDMRSCQAAIVHVGDERRLMDAAGAEHSVINPNVLIEIGAAMALYQRRFVLLVERGVELPSNLQGLYEVRYEGEQLDHDATMKLLEAFNDFR
jgi:hypothetical protein